MLRDWSDDVLHREEGVSTIPPAAVEAAKHLFQYLTDMVKQARGARRENLTDVLLEAEIEGDRHDDSEIVGFLFLQVVAANGTPTARRGTAPCGGNAVRAADAGTWKGPAATTMTWSKISRGRGSSCIVTDAMCRSVAVAAARVRVVAISNCRAPTSARAHGCWPAIAARTWGSRWKRPTTCCGSCSGWT